MVDFTQQTIPAEVEAVFKNFFTCELTTFAKDGTPVTWPVMPIYVAARQKFLVLTSIGFAQKVYNVWRNPKVAMLFSDPTASNLVNPPTVLVQGIAEAPDELYSTTSERDPAVIEASRVQLRRLMATQPTVGAYLSNPIARYLMDWYFIRLAITVYPQRITWWPVGIALEEGMLEHVA